MQVRVECGAGPRGDPEPVVVWLGKRRLAVRGIVDRWFAPTQRWFRIDAEDDQWYVLRHDETTGDWELVALTRRDARDVQSLTSPISAGQQRTRHRPH